MQRRDFIRLLGGVAAAWPVVARAQQGSRVRRIGMLMGYAEADPDTQARMAAFKSGLDQLGWKDDHNIQITFRFGVGEMDRIRESAKELVDLNPDVIVCETTPTLRIMRQQTATLPIVFISVSDPVSTGFVADLAHPGGNMTGFTNFEASMGGKWIELLKKIAPGVSRVGIMFNPDTTTGRGEFFLRPIEASAPLLAAQVVPLAVQSDIEIGAAITALASEPGAGLIVLLDVFTAGHRPGINLPAGNQRGPNLLSLAG